MSARDRAEASTLAETEDGPRDRCGFRAPGALLAGRFELRRVLGAGSSGAVYRAYDRELRREVALKVLRRLTPRSIARLKSEARALRDFSHPNLVTVLDLVVDGEEWLLSMELIEGVPLNVAWRGAAPEALLGSLAQLAAGVRTLHAGERVHRDLKPSNILVERGGRVVIVDFGLVRSLVFADTERGFVGSPAYAAPEQLAGLAAGPGCDWYAVGVMLYEALHGALPHTAGAAALAHEKLQKPGHPSCVATELERELCALSLGLLEPDASVRFGGEDVLALLTRRGQRARDVLRRDEQLVGREPELSRLRRAFARVEADEAWCVSIVGESGVGKSLLVESAMAELAREHKALVLFSRCHPQEQVPFPLLDPVIDGLVSHLRGLQTAQAAGFLHGDVHVLARLFPALAQLEALASVPAPSMLGSASEAALFARAARALATLIERLAALLPVVLVLEDVDQSAADDRLLLELVLHDLRGRVLWLTTSRAETNLCGKYLRSERLPLGSLSPRATERLVATRLGSFATRPRVARLTQASGGHPLFARVLCEQIVDDEAAPVSLRAALGSMLARLTPTQRSVLEVLAVAERPLPRALLFDCTNDVTPRCLSQLIFRGFVGVASERAGGLAYALQHDQLAEAVRETLDDARRVRLHAALADAYLCAGGDEQPAVKHLLEAGRAREAGELALRLARSALDALALRRAAELLRIAAEHGAANDELDRMVAVVFPAVGEHRRAAALFLRRARETHGEQRFQLRRRAMESSFLAGDYEQGCAQYDALGAELGLSVPRGRFALSLRTLLWTLRYLCFPLPEQVDPRAVSERQRRRGELALSGCAVQLNDLLAWAYATAVAMRETARAGFAHEHCLLRLAFATGVFAVSGLAGRRALRARERAAELLVESPLRDWLQVGVGTYELHVGCLAEAVPAFEAALEAPTEPGKPTARRFAQHALLVSWFFVGAFGKIRAHVDAFRAEAERADDRQVGPVLRLFSALLMLERDVARARAELRSLEQRASWQRSPISKALWWPAWFALYAGEPEQAYRIARALPFRRSLKTSRVDHALGVFVRGQVCAATLRAHPRRMRELKRAARRLSGARLPFARALSWLLHAAAAGGSAPWRALDLLARAERELEALSLFGFAAAARARRGELMGGAAGAALYERALERLYALGFHAPGWLHVLTLDFAHVERPAPQAVSGGVARERRDARARARLHGAHAERDQQRERVERGAAHEREPWHDAVQEPAE